MSHNTETSIKQLKSERPSSKLNIPPSKVSGLSPKTLEVLNTLNFSSAKSTYKSSDDILNSIPAREKYFDLLDPVLKLSLPYKYKRLMQISEYLDTTLNNARIRGLPHFFSNLKQAIESTYNCTVDLEQIQRILCLCPDFYKLSWVQESTEVKLLIDLPEDSSYSLSVLHNRTAVLKDELLKRVKALHKQHLDAAGLSFDPDVCRTWHSSFPLHEVPELPLAELPEAAAGLQSGKQSAGSQLRALRLASLCSVLSGIFNHLQIPSLFVKSLIKKVLESREQEEDHKLVAADLVELSEIFPSWFKIIKTESGDVARLNKQSEFSFKAFSRKINEKYSVN